MDILDGHSVNTRLGPSNFVKRSQRPRDHRLRQLPSSNDLHDVAVMPVSSMAVISGVVGAIRMLSVVMSMAMVRACQAILIERGRPLTLATNSDLNVHTS